MTHRSDAMAWVAFACAPTMHGEQRRSALRQALLIVRDHTRSPRTRAEAVRLLTSLKTASNA